MATGSVSSNKWQFSEEEIRAKLEELGYNNIPDKALKEFQNDLHKLVASENAKEIIHHRESTTSTSSTFNSPTTTTSNHSIHIPPAYVGHAEGRVAYTSTADSDGESSFEKSPITQHSRPYAYTLAEKENQVESRHPASLKMTQKRKVLRKKNGESHVFDESFNNEAATDISDVEKRLQKLPIKDETDSESFDDDDMSERSSVLQPWGRNRNALPSFIRPKTADSHTRGLRKTDPVSRYHQFKQEWTSNKVPGEKMHKSLRWSTREQMLQYESFEKPQHRYVPNNYVAPTQKKRQALRWEVRTALANC